MSLSVESYEPTDRLPNVALGEFQTGHLVGDGMSVAFTGNGELGHVYVNAAASGKTAKFYDAGADDTPSDDNLIKTVACDAVDEVRGRHVVHRGLTVITDGAAVDVSFQLRGRPTTSPRTFRN